MIAQPRRHSLALKKSGFLHKEFYSQAFYLVQAGIPMPAECTLVRKFAYSVV